jgi:hypothetical protein
MARSGPIVTLGRIAALQGDPGRVVGNHVGKAGRAIAEVAIEGIRKTRIRVVVHRHFLEDDELIWTGRRQPSQKQDVSETEDPTRRSNRQRE